MIVAGLLLHIGGSALGYFAATAWTLVIARTVQGLGAVSGPVMALLADRTRAASRTRAMAFIGISGPLLAGAIGVAGIFALIGGLGIVALMLILFAVPKEAARESGQGRQPWRRVLIRRLLPHYSGIFVLHLSLTAAFIAVPHALRDVHGMAAADHWQFYLAVFASSLLLTVPMLLWSERSNRPARTSVIGGLLLAAAQVALALCYLNFMAMAVAVVIFFGAFNFLEARLPSSLSEAAGEDARGAALGVFSTCQFAGAFAGGILGGGLLGSAAGIPGVFLLAGLAAAGWLTVAGRSESP
ncbi:MAG: Major facilitator family transporter [Steroidobacteraceae bacterium]|nr:Major facilitator family transporter [Steroidobacteraceae bacterium]